MPLLALIPLLVELCTTDRSRRHDRRLLPRRRLDASDGHARQERVSSLAPELTKGPELDLVVLVRPEVWGEGVRGAVDRYVAMTRATSELVILG